MKTRYVTKKCTATFGPGHTPLSVYTIDLPAGLRVSEIIGEPRRPHGTKQYFLDEFPVQIFARDSFVYHDAIHYGVRLEQSQVEAI